MLAATLNLTSCTEVLEPNIDYGGNTYINDYTALVKAVNDLQKSLEERFDALNTLLQNGMAEIKLSIDENTGAIKILTSTTQSGLDKINTSLFNGFDALNTQIKTTGDAIIFAMNENGELLRLKIDENGKLLETTLLANNAALIKCINDNSKTLDERFAALTAAVKAGFTDITASVDKNTGAITLLDKNTNTSLDKINTSLVNGFKAINEHLDSNGNTIVEALNKNNELLTLTISKNGELIEAAIKGQTTAIVAAINDQTKALDERIKALNELITSGLKDIKLEINANTGAISLLDKNTNNSLGKINQNLLDGFANLNTKLVNIDQTLTGLSGNVAKVETAINTQGELIVSKLDKNNNILETNVCGSLADLSNKLNSFNTSFNDKMEVMSDLINAGLLKMETTNSNLGTIGGHIKDLNTSMTNCNGKLDAINGSISNVQGTLNSMNGSIGTLTNKIESGFTTVSKKVEDNGTTVVKAINENGELMTTIFGKDGAKLTAISTKLETLTNNLNDSERGLPAILKAQKALDDAITNPSTGLTAVEKENAKQTQALLATMLKDNGIYEPTSSDGTYMYMDPSLWASVESAGKNSSIYQAISEMIDGSVPTINCTQVTPGSWHTCAKFTPTKSIAELKANAELVSGKPETSSEANGKQVVRIVKVVKEDIEYTVDVSSCYYSTMYIVRVYDARGDYQIYGAATGSRSSNPSTKVPSTTSSKVKVILRPYYNGNICINIRAFAFSYINSNDLPSLFWASDKMTSSARKRK